MPTIYEELENTRRKRNRTKYNRIDRSYSPKTSYARGAVPYMSPGPMMRKAVVKLSYHTKMNPKHLDYLLREGAGSTVFSETDTPDPQAIRPHRLAGEERTYRIIISPEQGERISLKEYARNFMQKMSDDLGQQFHWVAVTHDNTAHPHIHILLRGVDTKKNPVYIPRHYAKSGMRTRAQELATARLGLKSRYEIEGERERAVFKESFTLLDRSIDRRLDVRGKIPSTALSPTIKRRLAVLVSMGLAIEGKKNFRLMPGWQQMLRSMQKRNDIMKIRQQLRFQYPDDTIKVLTDDRPISGTVEEVVKNPLYDTAEFVAIRTSPTHLTIRSARGLPHNLTRGKVLDHGMKDEPHERK